MLKDSSNPCGWDDSAIGFNEGMNFMRSADVTQAATFSYRTLEDRIAQEHPLKTLRTLVDGIRVTLHAEFEMLYAGCGWPSIPPERLLRASLIQPAPYDPLGTATGAAY